MSRFRNLICFIICGLLLPLSAVQAQVSTLSLPPSSGAVSYANYPIDKLNRAHRQKLSGQFEEALLTYNSAVAFQPNWVPALTARAELLYRLGRNVDAKRDRMRAEQTSVTATSFFLARGRNALLPFLALYPHDWYVEQYGFPDNVELPREASVTPRTFFAEQYLRITESEDDSPAVQALQEKVSQNVSASRQLLNSLPRDYNKSVRRMLEGNLALLNHDYPAAINLYSDALASTSSNWREIYYNRGLASILIYNYMNGCSDLQHAAQTGYTPAITMYDCLCNM